MKTIYVGLVMHTNIAPYQEWANFIHKKTYSSPSNFLILSATGLLLQTIEPYKLRKNELVGVDELLCFMEITNRKLYFPLSLSLHPVLTTVFSIAVQGTFNNTGSPPAAWPSISFLASF